VRFSRKYFGSFFAEVFGASFLAIVLFGLQAYSFVLTRGLCLGSVLAGIKTKVEKNTIDVHFKCQYWFSIDFHICNSKFPY
jgi:hypothetical protein